MVDAKKENQTFETERKFSNLWKEITGQIDKELFIGTCQLMTLIGQGK